MHPLWIPCYVVLAIYSDLVDWFYLLVFSSSYFKHSFRRGSKSLRVRIRTLLIGCLLILLFFCEVLNCCKVSFAIASLASADSAEIAKRQEMCFTISVLSDF